MGSSGSIEEYPHYNVLAPMLANDAPVPVEEANRFVNWLDGNLFKDRMIFSLGRKYSAQKLKNIVIAYNKLDENREDYYLRLSRLLYQFDENYTELFSDILAVEIYICDRKLYNFYKLLRNKGKRNLVKYNDNMKEFEDKYYGEMAILEAAQLRVKISELEAEISELRLLPPGVGGPDYEAAKLRFDAAKIAQKPN